ncbi:hypothetical protein [Streptomyces sp. NBC_01750]|uniref:hypothetical protein n=1 Tax=Streptomyces sp. NBC_01750 TaxID=2975928 RepID=UPI002DDC65F4|nr:hypothetical protein [Streptomyces sp. NBC_01750]WSD38096.1 hypothetical protein OG966_40310 [Streptomyces sp. NBC_01750]
MVPAEVHAQAYENAKAAGVSMGRYIAELIRRDQVDDNGRPVWAAEAFGDHEQVPLTG